MSHILNPHIEATVDRCRQEPLVIANQDKTSINYTVLKGTSGLAKLGGGGEGNLGVLPLALPNWSANLRPSEWRRRHWGNELKQSKRSIAPTSLGWRNNPHSGIGH